MRLGSRIFHTYCIVEAYVKVCQMARYAQIAPRRLPNFRNSFIWAYKWAHIYLRNSSAPQPPRPPHPPRTRKVFAIHLRMRRSPFPEANEVVELHGRNSIWWASALRIVYFEVKGYWLFYRFAKYFARPTIAYTFVALSDDILATPSLSTLMLNQ